MGKPLLTWDEFRIGKAEFHPILLFPLDPKLFRYRDGSARVQLTCPHCGEIFILSNLKTLWWGSRKSCDCLLKTATGKKSPFTLGEAKEILAKRDIEILNIEHLSDNLQVSKAAKVGVYRFKCNKCGIEFGSNFAIYRVISGLANCTCTRAENIKQRGVVRRGISTPAMVKSGLSRRGVQQSPEHYAKLCKIGKDKYNIYCNEIDEELGKFGSRVKIPFEGPVGTLHKIVCICKCDREFTSNAVALKMGTTRSCKCLKSMLEIKLYEFILSLVPDAIKNSRKIIRYYNGNVRELDIWIPSLNLAIEFDGLRWHGEVYALKKNRPILLSYHKYLLCKEKNVRLITIFEDEWRYEEDRIKEYLRSVILNQEQLIPVGKDGTLITENRLTNNQLYLDAGYKILEEIAPAFHLTSKGRRIDEILFPLEGESEWDCIRRLKLDRVWDCGKTKWSLERPSNL